MGLKEYWKKRDFEKTPEPSGHGAVRAPHQRLSFCIQKHAASRLNSDFRLELDGVLKDEEARRGTAPAITESRPESVKTHRTIEEIAARSRSTWHSNRVAATRPKPATRKKAPASTENAAASKKAPVRKTAVRDLARVRAHLQRKAA